MNWWQIGIVVAALGLSGYWMIRGLQAEKESGCGGCMASGCDGCEIQDFKNKIKEYRKKHPEKFRNKK